MEIFFSDIPEHGLAISGKLEPQRFDLSDQDSIRVTGDVTFDLTLYRFDESVVMSGQVSGTFELQCVTCLEFFPYQAVFSEWQTEVDIEENQRSFDPRESLRDEILLALPSTPWCDETREDKICPKAELLSQFEHDEKPLEESAKPPKGEDGKEGDDVWNVLDQLEKE